jgi:hypothetical protein
VDVTGQVNAEMMTPLDDVRAPERYLVRDGDVVFQARGTRNLAFALRGVPAKTLASNHFYIVRMRSDAVLPEYLAWFVNQLPAQAHLTGKAQGTTMMLVSKETFETLEVDTPPLDVQRMIVELVALRQHERELVENLECRRDTLIRRLCLSAVQNSKGGTPTNVT